MKRLKFDDLITTKAIGRPPLPGGRRVQVYLGLEALDAARKLGEGNVSKGIRTALKRAQAENVM